MIAARLRHLLVRLASAIPFRTSTKWQWYRRAVGGRWSRSTFGDWYQRGGCPAAFNTEISFGHRVPDGCCSESADGKTTVCACEVWP